MGRKPALSTRFSFLQGINMAVDIIPSALAFARSIEPSLFAMWGANSASPQAQLRPVKIIVETKRGTIANALKPDALEKFVTGSDNSKSPGNANPQSVEAAYLPEGSNTLVLTGQVAFIPNCRAPAMSNGERFNTAYKAFDESFMNSDGWTALARRYVMNLANARFAWRNKVAAQSISVTLTDSRGATATIDSMAIPANSGFDTETIVGLTPFVAGVAAALGAPHHSPAYVISIACRLKLGEGAVVYPSQEFSSSKDKDDRGQEVGKILAKRELADGSEQGILHEQKIGNAIRQIDTWYHPTLGPLQPRAAEPYAPLTTMGTFYRQGLRTRGGNQVEHFYDILADIEGLTKQVKGATKASDRALYFAAVLVRGGVFGAKADQA